MIVRGCCRRAVKKTLLQGSTWANALNQQANAEVGGKPRLLLQHRPTVTHVEVSLVCSTWEDKPQTTKLNETIAPEASL